MPANFEYLIERYLCVLDRAAVETGDEATRAELDRHRDRARQYLVTWRLNGRLEDLRERLREELRDYQAAACPDRFELEKRRFEGPPRSWYLKQAIQSE